MVGLRLLMLWLLRLLLMLPSRRKNFGSVAQDVLNIWRKLTGLNLVLLAGECIDGDANYDSCV